MAPSKTPVCDAPGRDVGVSVGLRLGLIAAGVALAGLLCTSAVPVAEPAAAPQEVCIVAPPQPYDPASGLALHAPRPVPVDARCPVCGMYPARNPDWAAQLVFANGDTHAISA